MFWTYFLIICSLLVLIWTAGIMLWRYKFDSKLRLKKNFIAVILVFTAVILLIGAGMNAVNTTEGKLGGAASYIKVLSYTFMLFTINSSFDEAMQWVSLIENGFFRGLYTGLSVLYSGLTPLAGGFIVFNLLSSVAPKFKLVVKSYKRTKYVFSELNERSVTLAEDIAEQSWYASRRINSGVSKEHAKWLRSSALIFMNVRRDDADSELLERASRIGAICLSGDILEQSFNFFTPFSKKVVYLMMDTNPWSNLDSAVTLLSAKRDLWKRTLTERSHEDDSPYQRHVLGKRRRKFRLRKTDNMNMYVFTENPEASSLLEEAFGYNCEIRDYAYFKADKDKWASEVAIAKCDGNITVFVVNEYKNLVYGLLSENGGDAFLSLLNAPSGQLENAKQAEAASAAASAEQKDGKRLKIAVFGSGKIAKEFFKTAVWCSQMLDPDEPNAIDGGKGYKRIPVDLYMISENAKDFEQGLKFSSPGLFDDSGHCAYLRSANFENASFGSQEFLDMFDEYKLDDANFFLIALGDDDLNMQVASWTRTRLLRNHAGRQANIYFAIENDALCKTLKLRKGDSDAVKLHPFGSLKERFSFDNIMRPDIERVAREIDSIYSGRRTMRACISNYNFESSLASALHSPFREYSERGIDLNPANVNAVNRMYWLEHLRWCAYSASIGLVGPSAKCFFANKDKDGKLGTKNMKESWHSCILQSEAEYVKPQVQLKKIMSAFGVDIPKQKNGKDDMKAALAKLNELVIPADETTGADMALDKYIADWYNNHILKPIEDKAKNNDSKLKKLHEELSAVTDPLDLLSIFMSVYNKEPKDIKSYDIRVAKKTFVTMRQQTIADELKKASPDMQTIRQQVKEIMKAPSDKDEDDEEEKVYDKDDMRGMKTAYIASVHGDDLMLLSGEYIAQLIQSKKGDGAGGGKHDKRVMQMDDGALLVRVTTGKPVCIGYRTAEFKKGDKTKRKFLKAYLYQEARHCYVLEHRLGDGERASAFDNLTYVYIGEYERMFKKSELYNLSMSKPYEAKISPKEAARNVELQRQKDEADAKASEQK